MGLMDPESMGNGDDTTIPKLKGKYMRMDGQFNEEETSESMIQRRKKSGRSDSEKYVFACAVFASLNNVLLGYGQPKISPSISNFEFFFFGYPSGE